MPRIALFFVAAALLITILAGCRQAEPAALKGPANSDNITENLLQAFTAGDYLAYLACFDVPVTNIMSQDWFMQTSSLVHFKVGTYVAGSKEIYEIKPNEEYTDVIYKTDFSDEPDGVYVTVAFIISDNHTSPAGIWFNSPKLFSQP